MGWNMYISLGDSANGEGRGKSTGVSYPLTPLRSTEPHLSPQDFDDSRVRLSTKLKESDYDSKSSMNSI